jgi:hypothetical protein
MDIHDAAREDYEEKVLDILISHAHAHVTRHAKATGAWEREADETRCAYCGCDCSEDYAYLCERCSEDEDRLEEAREEAREWFDVHGPTQAMRRAGCGR